MFVDLVGRVVCVGSPWTHVSKNPERRTGGDRAKVDMLKERGERLGFCSVHSIRFLVDGGRFIGPFFFFFFPTAHGHRGRGSEKVLKKVEPPLPMTIELSTPPGQTFESWAGSLIRCDRSMYGYHQVVGLHTLL